MGTLQAGFADEERIRRGGVNRAAVLTLHADVPSFSVFPRSSRT